MTHRSIAFALAALLTAATPALAQHAGSHGVELSDAWARASPGAAKMGAAYVTLHNPGKTADRLVGASAPVADSIELHMVQKDGDILRMRPTSAIEVGPGATTKLEPGGYHLMLMGLKAPLKNGDRFPLQLRFEHAGTETVEVKVGPSVDAPQGRAGGHGHGHSHN